MNRFQTLLALVSSFNFNLHLRFRSNFNFNFNFSFSLNFNFNYNFSFNIKSNCKVQPYGTDTAAHATIVNHRTALAVDDFPLRAGTYAKLSFQLNFSLIAA